MQNSISNLVTLAYPACRQNPIESKNTVKKVKHSMNVLQISYLNLWLIKYLGESTIIKNCQKICKKFLAIW